MVTAYSQKDERWKDLTFSPAKLTIGEFGCFIVSLSVLCDQPPDIVLEILERNGCFNKDGRLLSDLSAKALGLSYRGKAKKRPLANNFPCIIEVDFYAPAYSQHFCVLLDEHRIIDPLDGKEHPNKYKDHIVSYRLFSKKRSLAEVYPARPPDKDDPPVNGAKEKLKEFAENKPVIIEKIPNLWERMKIVLSRILKVRIR